MRLEHRKRLDTPIEQVWASFMDLKRVGDCFPGGHVIKVDGDDFVGLVTVTAGPLKVSYDGVGSMTRRDEANRHASIRATGRERHGLAAADIAVDLHLSAPDETTTDALLITELKVKGSPTNLGRGLGQRISDPLIDRFLACMGCPHCDAEPSGEVDSLDLARTILPDLMKSYSRSAWNRLRHPLGH